MPDQNDPRKPLFPEDADDRFSLEPDDEGIESESEFAPSAPVADEPPEKIYTPPAERFPPVDPAALEPEPSTLAPAPHRPRILINLATVFFILGTFVALGYFALLWVNPSHPLNPLPPYTPLPIIITTTPLPSTVTPVPTLPTVTSVPPTASWTPAPEQVIVPATSAPATPGEFPFALWEFGVEYIANQNDSGCDWSSIGGNLVDLDGIGIADYGVRIIAQEGTLNATVTTGEATFFGSGGFELKLGDVPTLEPYIVQLLDADGTPVSEEYLVVTSDECNQNVVVLNFVQNRPL